jgi:hypothetical protein
MLKTILRNSTFSLTLFVGLLSPMIVLRAEEVVMVSFEKDIAPIVDRYCVECHNEDNLKGDLNLLRFETSRMVLDSLALWQRAGMRVENREMPPKKSDQPSDEERALLVDWIKSLKFDAGDCDRLATEESVAWYRGYVMSRRLNRDEYENTLRDLLGVDLPLRELFPSDGAGGEGFDNNGDALFLSAIQVEKYLDAAEMAIEAAMPPNALGPAEARRRLIPSAPHDGREPRAAALDDIERFVERAWRRPVEPDELEGMLSVFDRTVARGDSYEAGIKLAYTAALVSPNFIFLVEPEPETPGVYTLGDYPLASRLSYLLWSSMPDEELFALARGGRLQDEEVLREQVLRMMRDPKARALGDQFAAQWLGISQLGETIRPDTGKFPEFDETLLFAMREETSAYFTHIVREDRSLLELIDSDYTFANENLADIYGIGGILGQEMRKVTLPVDSYRGGVLGMAAILTATSHPLRTSPVLRGKWVLEQLLGDRVPPPPPDVGVLEEAGEHEEALTLRRQLEIHREQAECASCHARMDPIGFGLENFDPIGRWRDLDAGQSIDSEGVLPSGESFSGPGELKQILLARRDQFARNLSRKMLGYALGRSLTPYDECVIDRSVEALRENDYRASELFTTIVLSYPFRHRYSGGET